MASLSLFVIDTLLIGCTISMMDVVPPAWPVYWSGYVTEVNTDDFSNIISAGGWWYDFTKYPQSDGLCRQDMDYGCNGGGFKGSCRGIFKNNNFYQYSPDQNLCCLSFPDLPATPPNWLVNISISTGTARYQPTGVVSDVWSFLSTHTYYSAAATGLPVGERGIADPHGTSTDMVWYSVTLNKYNESVFDLPSGCNKPCLKNTGQDIMLRKVRRLQY